ncbi:glycosyltransferase [Maribacter luteus]|uniref:glycosyltransferase n=1 Tax=Maribacter luteus TaxID=2594478 RepID=UPI002492A600|nr:glycosyltransferase [Maribacter luteus]
MIFITLGNQNFQFSRFLEKIEQLVLSQVINGEVIAQIGHTDFQSSLIKTIDFLPMDKFNEYVEQSDYVISHAGTGSLISCLRKEKGVISGARLKKYNEHIDNHQVEILEAFSNKNFILGLKEDFSDFEEKIGLINTFIPEKFKSNNGSFNDRLIEIIDNLSLNDT